LLNINFKYLLFFLLFCVTSVLSAQDVPFVSTPPDTIKNDTSDSLYDYEIIYEIDTVYQTKTIIEYDTIVQTDSIRENKSDTIESIKLTKDTTTIHALIPENKKANYFFTGINFSGFIFLNTLKSLDPNQDDYISTRKNYEEPMPSFSFALTPGYKFNRWSIQSGIQYSQFRNKYNYPFSIEKFLTSVVMQDTSYSVLQNDTIDIYYQVIGSDTAWFYIINQHWVNINDSLPHIKNDTTYEYQTNKGIQYYHFVEIPLIFGYDLFKSKRFNIDFSAGVIASFLVYRKGEIVSFNDVPTFISLKNYPFVNISLSGYLGFGIRYSLSNKLNIELRPFYQKGISSFIQKNSSLTQTLDKKGILLGLQFRF
jgi:hypothetical protein